MNNWGLGGCIAAFGALGGLIACLLPKTQSFASSMQAPTNKIVAAGRILRLLILGAFAAATSWGLYGPLSTEVAIGTKPATQSETHGLTLGALAAAVIVGVGGTKWFMAAASIKEATSTAEAASDTVSPLLARLQEILSEALQSAMKVISAGQTIAPEKQKSLIEEAVKAGRASLEAQGVSVDMSELKGGGSRVVIIPVDENAEITDFLNQVYLALGRGINPYTYGKDWQLARADGDSNIYMGPSWAMDHGKFRDNRRLKDVEISPGVKLKVKRLNG